MASTKAPKREKPIPERKLAEVKELKSLVKDKKSLVIASIKNLPAALFQDIKKQLRGKALIKVPKKNLAFRAIDDAKDEELSKIKEYVGGETAFVFSDQDSFDLAGTLLSYKVPGKAKSGMEAPIDIVVKKGPTELMPGPAMTELQAVNIPIMIDKGKIAVKEDTVIVKQGETISTIAAEVMNKLDIKPFTIGFTPVAAYDISTHTLYTSINIDTDATRAELVSAFAKALPFALNISYISEETITHLLGKARREEMALEKLVGAEPAEEQKEEVKEESTEEKKEESKGEDKEEEKPSESPEDEQKEETT